MFNHTQKILVVDDEPDLQVLMMQKFREKVKSREYEFVFAEDGQEALNTISEDEEINLILSDINMPRMDGLSLLNELHRFNRETMLTVMVSAYGDMDNIRTAMNRGAFDFVTKPIDFKDLEITIQKSLNEVDRIFKAKQNQVQLDSLNTELDMAARIQNKLIPQNFPVFPEDKRFDIFGGMMAARHVGGDFYDFFKYDENHIAFFIGDVAGKGMPAAIYMAVCRTMLKAIGSEIPDPAECIAKVNNMLIPESEESTFVTVFYGILNVNTGELKYCNAGHNLPFLVKTDGNVDELKDVGGLLLGKFENAAFDSASISMKPGDSLMTFTDGVTEAGNEKEEFFDEERVISFLEKNHSKSLQSMTKGLFLEVMKFAGAVEQSDDVTVMSIRYDGTD